MTQRIGKQLEVFDGKGCCFKPAEGSGTAEADDEAVDMAPRRPLCADLTELLATVPAGLARNVSREASSPRRKLGRMFAPSMRVRSKRPEWDTDEVLRTSICLDSISSPHRFPLIIPRNSITRPELLSIFKLRMMAVN